MHAAHSSFSHHDLDRLEAETPIAETDFHETIGSTSDRAIELCKSAELIAPLLVLANQQTAGRGRGANRWLTAAGALTFSLVVDARQLGIEPDALPQVSLATAIALCEALNMHEPSLDYRLKWPNDLYASTPGGQPRKLAGILLERPPGAAARLVIGIGLNVNNSLVDAPEELRQRATSLHDLTGRQYALSEVLIELLNQIDMLLTMLSQSNLDLPALWRPNCLLRGRMIQAVSGNRTISGECHGIDAEGALLIRQERIMQRVFSATIQQW